MSIGDWPTRIETKLGRVARPAAGAPSSCRPDQSSLNFTGRYRRTLGFETGRCRSDGGCCADRGILHWSRCGCGTASSMKRWSG